MKNKWKLAIGMWLGYVWVKTLAGLAIHPYKSIKKMIFNHEKILLLTTFSPVGFLIILMIVGRIGSYELDLLGWEREIVAGILGISLIGLSLWQILMLVLIWRFWRVQKGEDK